MFIYRYFELVVWVIKKKCVGYIKKNICVFIIKYVWGLIVGLKKGNGYLNVYIVWIKFRVGN